MSFERLLFLLPGLIVGLTFHEAAHAWSARQLGDATAERLGRLSLNPLRHLSAMGTLALFFLGFGWGKPVPVNIYNFRKPKLYYLLSSLAGPAANLLLCGISLPLIWLGPAGQLKNVLVGVFLINGVLAAINLIPIPPLDGSKIWPCLIPGMKPVIGAKWGKVWMIVLLVFFFSGGLDKVMTPVFGFLLSLLPK